MTADEIEKYKLLREHAYWYARHRRTDHQTAEDFASFCCIEEFQKKGKAFKYMFPDFCRKENVNYQTLKGLAKKNAKHIHEHFYFEDEIETQENVFQLQHATAHEDIERFIDANGKRIVDTIVRDSGKILLFEAPERPNVINVVAPSFIDLDKWRGGTMMKSFVGTEGEVKKIQLRRPFGR